ncbi:MAG: DUF748 domain-containing protein [Cyanothece sp. SIO1E1]|nr:DUF748 domain-containing protein [Cyanothece sp. SIO1E1]
MTNSPSNSPPEPESPQRRSRVFSKLTLAGIILVASGTAGYVGLRFLINERLSPLVSAQLSQLLNRPVEVGSVQGFSLNSVRFGPSAIPTAPNNVNHASVEAVDVRFDLLPALLNRTLPVEITLIQPQVYAAQDRQGNWLNLNLNLGEGELPVDLDLTFQTQDADVLLVPRGQLPLAAILTGDVRYAQDQPQRLQYDARVAVADSTLAVKGETLLETGQSKVNARVQALQLTELNPLIANIPATLKTGELNANLNIELPSFKAAPSVMGTARLQGVQVITEQLPQPVSANALLRFQGQQVKVEDTAANYGDITALLSGEVDWQAGIDQPTFDLAVDVAPVDLAKLDQTVPVQLPVELAGQVEANVRLKGSLAEPVLSATLSNQTVTRIAETEFAEIRVDLEGDRTQLALTNLLVKPVVGGQIAGTGVVEAEFINILQAEDAAVALSKLPLAFDFQAELPTDAIAAPYGLSPEVKLGTLTAQAQVQGTAQNPEIDLQWRLPSATAAAVGSISGSGTLLVREQSVLLQDTALSVGGGTLEADGKIDLQTLAWQALVNADAVELAALGESAQAQVDLSGNFQSLLDPDTPTTVINVNAVSAQLGQQSLAAQGTIVAARPPQAEAPWSVSTELDIEARSNLAALPIDKVIGQPQTAAQIDLRGLANFQGRLQAENLLADLFAPGNLQLRGDLRLENLGLNQVRFEPVLAGAVNVAPGQAVAIDLQGRRDRIAASLDPCTQPRCLAPYLPTSFEVRQGGTLNSPDILALGSRQGDRLAIAVKNFDVALLNITPATQLGIQGPLGGQVTGQLNTNLFTLATTGSIEINQPALGYIVANRFAGDFSYSENRAQLRAAVLELGQSQYQVSGGLNLQSGQVDGNIKVEQGRVEDLLTAVRWFTLQDLTRGFQSPVYATATAVPTDAIGQPQASIFEQLRLFSIITNNLKQLAAQLEADKVPTQLDIRGAYDGEIQLSGTLGDPNLAFSLQGNDWQWFPKTPILVVSDRQGPTLQNRDPVTIDRVIVEGNFQDESINLRPARIEVGETILAFEGGLSLQGGFGTFEVANLSVEQIRRVVEIPPELEGNINVMGQVSGTLTQPAASGEIEFAQASFAGTPLDQLTGEFDYANARFNFRTTQPAYLQVQASAPLPPTPGNDLVTLEAELGTEAIALLGTLSQGQIEWIDGVGEVQLQAQGRFDASPNALNRLIDDLLTTATGLVTLEDATVKSAVLTESITLNGQIALANQRLRVESLNGDIEGNQLVATGVLPLFQPLGINDPDRANPLTLSLDQGQVDLEGLYRGQVDADVILTGFALRPIIGGQVLLQNGRAFVPEQPPSSVSDDDTNTASGVVSSGSSLIEAPKLSNFQVTLGNNFRVAQFPIYRVVVTGDLLIDGTLDDLRPRGVLTLQRGNIDLIGNKFFLTRDFPQTITFVPERGLLNPSLNIQLETTVVDVPPAERTNPIDDLNINESELVEDFISASNPNQVRVLITADGTLNEVLALDTETISDNCITDRINTLQPTVGSVSLLSPEALAQVEACLGQLAFGTTTTARSLLENPIVTLSSQPPRTDSEIVGLLGGQLLATLGGLGQSIERGEEEELFEFAIVNYLIQPVGRSVFTRFEDTVRKGGEKINLSGLRIFPAIDATYPLTERSSAGFAIDYLDLEFRVRYRLQF